MRRILLLVAASLFLAPAAGATDGVLEINQACASVGCFSGDDPDWPVNITAPGSYVLTSNLVLPDANTRGIEVAAPSVSIDLGGFEITTVACLGATSDCTPESGGGSGIRTTSSDNRGISVTNGSITGMGSNGGVSLGDQGKVTKLRVRWNRGNGIELGDDSMISGNEAYGNALGVVAGAGSSISGNTSYANTASGFYVYGGSAIAGNTAYLNGLNGIEVFGDGSTVSGNTTNENGQRGDSDGYGIKVFSGSMVSGNTTRSNRLQGLASFGSGGADSSGYAGNVISDNGGTMVGGVEFGENLCDGNTTCP